MSEIRKVWFPEGFEPLDRDERITAYFRQVEAKHGYAFILNVSRAENLKPIHLRDLIVEPTFSVDQIHERIPESRWPARLSLVDVMKSNDRVVLLGDPGSGKSTIVNWLAYCFSQFGDNACKSALGWRLPVPLVLRELNLDGAGGLVTLLDAFLRQKVAKGLSRELLLEYFARGQAVLLVDGLDEASLRARRIVNAALLELHMAFPGVIAVCTSRIVGYMEAPMVEPAASTRSHRSTSGPFPSWTFSSFRGVADRPGSQLRSMRRISSTESRPEYMKYIRQVITNLASPHGYRLLDNASKANRQIPSFDEVVENIGVGLNTVPSFFVAPFDRKQIHDFVRNWFSVRGDRLRGEGRSDKALCDGIENSDTILALARRPNLLTFMALIYEAGGGFPESRLELYQEIERAYLYAIDRFYGQKSPFSLQEKSAVLSKIAYDMQCRRVSNPEHIGALLVDRRTLETWVSESLDMRSGLGDVRRDVREEARLFVDHIAKRSGLLIPRSEDLFAFAHLSFQEYFAACEVTRLLHAAVIEALDAGTGNWSERGEVGKWRLYAQEYSWQDTYLLAFKMLEPGWVGALSQALVLGDVVCEEVEDDPFHIPTLVDRLVLEGLPLRFEPLHIYWVGLGAKDSDVERLSGLAVLQSLNLGSTQVTDSGLKHVKNLTRLQSLKLDVTQVTDAGLEHLRGLIGLQRLSLDGTQVTGSGLKQLRRLTALRSLVLSGTKVTDSGLKHAKVFTGLQKLDLGETLVTDAGLEHLKNLTGLQTLILRSTKVTDAGLEHLKDLTGLQTLILTSTIVTEAGLEHLKDLTGLQTLHLGNTKLTDAGLEHLKGLTGLQDLDLSGTKVTDAGLEHLEGLTGLQWLILSSTKVTRAGKAALQAALPDCQIEP